MTKIVKLDEKSVAQVEEENPFIEYGRAVAKKPTLILGDILRFVKGEYMVGKEALASDTEVLAGMHLMYVGWIKWEDKKPVAHVMVRVASGMKPPKREKLGDTDEDQWPTDNKGEPDDPWKFTPICRS
jgi:hypothetical protein